MLSSHKVRTNIYLDEQIKKQAKKLFSHFGMSLSDAVNIFLAQSVYKNGIPFEVKLPNEITLQAMEDAKNGKTEKITLDELKREAKQCLS
jgi:DNA-damage-inducible protein J